MIRSKCSDYEMNTITLSNRYLSLLRGCLDDCVSAVNINIDESRKLGLPDELIESYEALKKEYIGMYYAFAEIELETETQFNLDEMMREDCKND